MVVLSCLITKKHTRQVFWHLRGALRSGLKEDEVEAIQRVIEAIAAECGVDVKTGMPRAADVPLAQR